MYVYMTTRTLTAFHTYNSRTFKQGTNAPDGDWSEAGELAEAHLEEEHREADRDERQAVRDQEGA